MNSGAIDCSSVQRPRVFGMSRRHVCSAAIAVLALTWAGGCGGSSETTTTESRGQAECPTHASVNMDGISIGPVTLLGDGDATWGHWPKGPWIGSTLGLRFDAGPGTVVTVSAKPYRHDGSIVFDHHAGLRGSEYTLGRASNPMIARIPPEAVVSGRAILPGYMLVSRPGCDTTYSDVTGKRSR